VNALIQSVGRVEAEGGSGGALHEGSAAAFSF
jgi:hypothetical protein